jgi:trk system potassium uptake protein TrkA
VRRLGLQVVSEDREGRLGGLSANRQDKMKIIILGCGRVGAGLATRLSFEGHDVTVVDKRRDAFRRLGPEFKGHLVRGLGIDVDVLKKAGIEEADAFISLTSGDNTNAMSAQMAKILFRVPKVVARIYDPIRAKEYKQLGIDTVCTSTIGVSIFHDYILCRDEQCLRQVLETYGEPVPPVE